MKIARIAALCSMVALSACQTTDGLEVGHDLKSESSSVASRNDDMRLQALEKRNQEKQAGKQAAAKRVAAKKAKREATLGEEGNPYAGQLKKALTSADAKKLANNIGEAKRKRYVEKARDVALISKTSVRLPTSADLAKQLAKPQAVTKKPTLRPKFWPELIAGMRLKAPKKGNAELVKLRKWHKKHAFYVNKVLDRSRPFIHHIKEKVKARGMPMEVVLLPAVESAFDPFAYSKGKAAGLWQFIPGTAKRFKLKDNWWFDARRDLHYSTDAALDYLQYLHKFFDGDWLLAFAAYNAGEGTVRRAIRRNKRAGKPTDFWSLKLPKETTRYVPKLLALSEAVRRNEHYKLKLPQIDNQVAFLEYDVPGQIDLAIAAEMAKCSLKELHRYNPAFKRYATDPEGPHRLLIPLKNVLDFEEGLRKRKRKNKQLIFAEVHTIKRGETLSHIARKYGASENAIRRSNGLKAKAVLVPGRKLSVPVPKRRKGRSKGYDIAAQGGRVNPPRGKERYEHVVASGESLWRIARRYEVSVKQLKNWNALGRKPLQVGHKLVLWLNSKQAALARLRRDS